MKVKLEDDGEDNSELIEEIEDSFIEDHYKDSMKSMSPGLLI